MKKLIVLIGLLVLMLGTVSALTLSDPTVAGSAVGDGSKAYIGSGSWAADGSKFGLWLPAESLFDGGFTIGEIVSLEFHTYKETEQSGLNFYVNIYTEPEGDDSDDAGWYGHRLTFEPMYSKNFDDKTGEWNTWTTDSGTNQLTVFDSNHAPFGWYYPPTLSELQSGNVDWNSYIGTADVTDIDYASQEVKYVVIDTGSAWAADFEGNVDALTITLDDKSSVTVDLEAPQEQEIPEFTAIGALAVLGLAGLFIARRRK